MRPLKLSVLALFAAALLASQVPMLTASSQSGPTEAPAGFDNQTNGFADQTTFDSDRAAFEKREEVATGLGPVYNAQSCAECHQNPVTGGVSQIFELRAGRSGPDGSFVAPPGGSLIQARAVNAQIQERVPDGSRIVFRGRRHKSPSWVSTAGSTASSATRPCRVSNPPSRPTANRSSSGGAPTPPTTPPSG